MRRSLLSASYVIVFLALLLPPAYAGELPDPESATDMTAVAPDGQSITLGDAVREALLRRPTLKAAEQSVLLSKAQMGASRSGYLPTLHASYSDI